jgi:hypothetical protein
VPSVIAAVLWFLGRRADDRRLKADAVRDLMTYRGDYFSSVPFRQALNKISIVFHDKEKIRLQIRSVYDIINAGILNQEARKRAIIGLIYNLCQMMGYKKLTEYDIDQSFVQGEGGQAPDASLDNPRTDVPPVSTVRKSAKRKRKKKNRPE